jgi:GT2 family glycosyltransferase
MNKVALIILNWNSAQVTIDCLRSISDIDYDQYRVFLVDNGSADGSVALIKAAINSDKIRYAELKYNYGFTGGNNIGIDLAREEYDPDYYLLLNNDTIVDKNFLKIMVRSFLRDPEIGIVVPKIFFYGDRSEYIYYAGGYINLISGLGEHFSWMKPDNPETNISKEVTFANGCSMLIGKEVIRRIGKLDDNFFANIEDVDYSYRVTAAGYKIFYNPESFLWHREGFASKKNIGHWFRIYLTTRNVILFQRKRSSFINFVLFVLYFSLRWVVYMTLKMLKSKDFKSIRSIFYGLSDGFSGKLRFVSIPEKIEFK